LGLTLSTEANPGADPWFVGLTRAKPLYDAQSAEQGWKKNGNQIMVRCLLKHHKIPTFQVNTVYKYRAKVDIPVKGIGSVNVQVVRIIGGYSNYYYRNMKMSPVIMWHIVHYVTLISRMTLYFEVHTYEKETMMFKIFITSCKST